MEDLRTKLRHHNGMILLSDTDAIEPEGEEQSKLKKRIILY